MRIMCHINHRLCHKYIICFIGSLRDTKLFSYRFVQLSTWSSFLKNFKVSSLKSIFWSIHYLPFIISILVPYDQTIQMKLLEPWRWSALFRNNMLSWWSKFSEFSCSFAIKYERHVFDNIASFWNFWWTHTKTHSQLYSIMKQNAK